MPLLSSLLDSPSSLASAVPLSSSLEASAALASSSSRSRRSCLALIVHGSSQMPAETPGTRWQRGVLALVAVLVLAAAALLGFLLAEEARAAEASACRLAAVVRVARHMDADVVDDAPEMDILRRVYERLRSSGRPDAVAADLVRLSGERCSADLVASEDLHGTVAFLRTLARAMAGTASAPPRRLHVVVAGGGPMGLASALRARALGHAVVVLEKRRRYTRTIWFDLYARPWYTSAETLRAYGLDSQISTIDESDAFPGAFTIQARSLEAFLAKALVVAGGHVRKSHKLVAICDAGRIIAATENGPGQYDEAHCATETGGTVQLHADLLIGADGTHSVVRAAIGATYERVDAFTLDGGHARIHIDDLHQPNLIVTLQPDADGNCPAGADGPAAADPFSIAFHLDGVTTVFKRFFRGHCQAQVLFERELGARVGERMADGDVPWDLLLDIFRLTLGDPPRDETAVRRLVATDGHGRPDVHFFHLAIHAADRLAGHVGALPAIVVGEAAHSAHYRLGIGVNSGFTASAGLDALLHALVAGDARAGVADYDAAQLAYARDVVNHQVRIMALETYCDFVIGFDRNAPSIFDAPFILQRNRAAHTFDDVDDPVAACPFLRRAILRAQR